MEARGFFERGTELTSAPKLRVGIGFGRDRVAAATAFVDTGSDLCLFPPSLFPWPLPAVRVPRVLLELADQSVVEASIHFPNITAGDIREPAVPAAILPDAPPILGRSFLNRLALRMAAAQDLVHLRTLRRGRG
jgi:hypothetical protein